MKGVLYVYPIMQPYFQIFSFQMGMLQYKRNLLYRVSPSSIHTMQCYVVSDAHIYIYKIHPFQCSTPSSNNKRHTMQSVSAQTPLLAHLIFSTRQKMMSKRDYIIMMNVQTFLVLRCDEYFTFCVLYAKCFSRLSLSDV